MHKIAVILVAAFGLGICPAAAPTTQPAREAPQVVKAGDTVAVVQDGTPLKMGAKVLAELKKGTQFRVTAINGDWVGGTVVVGGRGEQGWVRRADVALVRGDGTPRESEQAPDIEDVVPSPPAAQQGATGLLDAVPIPEKYRGQAVVWRGKVVSEDEVRIKDKGVKHYSVSFALCKQNKVVLTVGTQVEVRGKLSGRCIIGRDFKAGQLVNECYTLLLEEGAGATVAPANDAQGAITDVPTQIVSNPELRHWGQTLASLRDFAAKGFPGAIDIAQSDSRDATRPGPSIEYVLRKYGKPDRTEDKTSAVSGTTRTYYWYGPMAILVSKTDNKIWGFAGNPPVPVETPRR